MMSLADAIIDENLHIVSQLLQMGVDVNELDDYGFTPLIEAAIADHLEIAKMLIQAGADVNAQDLTGGTALQWAAENNNHALCQLLLDQGANPNSYNFAGQPVLVTPYLRQQQPVKKLLMQYGASLEFAQDYVNTKLLGHLFELVGTADIVDPRNQFVEVDFEGFMLEVTLNMISESLLEFNQHFAARKLRQYVQMIHIIVDVIHRAAQLIQYQQYRIDVVKHKQVIHALIKQEPLLIPIGYEGHAITFIKFGTLLVKCDRREDSRLYDNVMVYRIERPDVLTREFIAKLMYEKQTWDFINIHLPDLLELKPITEIKISAQVSGNCSWANVEATIPAMFFLLSMHSTGFEDIARHKNIALNFFQQWREWSKDRALQFCIQSFHRADSIRKACKAEILAAILFQCCNDGSVKNKERAESIFAVLSIPQYEPILQNYIKTYCYEDASAEGKNFLRLLKEMGYRSS